MSDGKDTFEDTLLWAADLDGRVERALDAAFQWGGVEGAHHRQWVIDQMVYELTGDGYRQWVAEYEQGGLYSWDTGVAP